MKTIDLKAVIKTFWVLVALSIPGYSNAQSPTCGWLAGENSQICFSYCSDWGDGVATGLVCGDIATNSLIKPIQIPFCFTNPSEWVIPTGHPEFPTRLRSPALMLCLPTDLCDMSLQVFRLYDFQGITLEELFFSNAHVYTGINRTTFCEVCPNSNYYAELRPFYYSEFFPGKYRLRISYTCCGSSEVHTFSIYYELINAVSNSDIAFGYTASAQIETLNGDPDIDGFLPYSGGFPGPLLGPASSGVRISSGGTGVIDYTVSVFQADCLDPTGGFTTLIHTQTIPYNGSQSITYSFLNIPNWENIYNANSCYKVEIEVRSICGIYKREGFFKITNTCTFCLTSPEDNLSLQAVDFFDIEVFPNPSNGIVEVISALPIAGIEVFDALGRSRVLQKFTTTEVYQQTITNLAPGVYYLKIKNVIGAVASKKIIVK